MYSFPLAENERIVKKGHASLLRDGSAYTGAFYLTNARLVFIGYMMNITQKHMEDVDLSQVREVLGGKSLLVFSNVLHILTIQGEKLKIVVSGRNLWLAAIREELGKQS